MATTFKDTKIPGYILNRLATIGWYGIDSLDTALHEYGFICRDGPNGSVDVLLMYPPQLPSVGAYKDEEVIKDPDFAAKPLPQRMATYRLTSVDQDEIMDEFNKYGAMIADMRSMTEEEWLKLPSASKIGDITDFNDAFDLGRDHPGFKLNWMHVATDPFINQLPG